MGVKLHRSAVIRGRVNNTQIWVQIEFEGIEAKGQPLSDGFQRRFLETPELEENPQALQAVYSFNGIRLGSREKPLSEFYSLQIPSLIFDVYTDPMSRRPRP